MLKAPLENRYNKQVILDTFVKVLFQAHLEIAVHKIL